MKLSASARSGSWPYSRSGKPATNWVWAVSAIRSPITFSPAPARSKPGCATCCSSLGCSRCSKGQRPGRISSQAKRAPSKTGSPTRSRPAASPTASLAGMPVRTSRGCPVRSTGPGSAHGASVSSRAQPTTSFRQCAISNARGLVSAKVRIPRPRPKPFRSGPRRYQRVPPTCSTIRSSSSP